MKTNYFRAESFNSRKGEFILNFISFLLKARIARLTGSLCRVFQNAQGVSSNFSQM